MPPLDCQNLRNAEACHGGNADCRDGCRVLGAGLVERLGQPRRFLARQNTVAGIFDRPLYTAHRVCVLGTIFPHLANVEEPGTKRQNAVARRPRHSLDQPLYVSPPYILHTPLADLRQDIAPKLLVVFVAGPLAHAPAFNTT